MYTPNKHTATVTSDKNIRSREQILSIVKNNQPAYVELPVLQTFAPFFTDVVAKYKEVLQSIGGKVYEVNTVNEMIHILHQQFEKTQRIISVVDGFSDYAELYQHHDDPHKLENVDVSIIKAHFAVAENGAIWVTEDIIIERVLPFICQHLVAVVNKKDIVTTMHEAYDRIAGSAYDFGTFIAGPSKTADIEQSLVLGAHGPKTMTAFIMNN